MQPISQHRIWEKVKKFEPQAVNKAIQELQKTDSSFNLDKGSWTSDRNWVKGYDQVLDPINQLSAAFHEKFDQKNADQNSRSYKEALLYLLLSQTSCFRYWGQGIWTDYARELCRRGMEIVEKGKTFVPLPSCVNVARIIKSSRQKAVVEVELSHENLKICLISRKLSRKLRNTNGVKAKKPGMMWALNGPVKIGSSITLKNGKKSFMNEQICQNNGIFYY